VTREDRHADLFEDYEELFDPLHSDRKARRRRKPEPRHVPKRPSHDIITELAEPEGLELGFQTTYQPSQYEEGWLLSSLRAFYDQGLISDVQALIKGGKEANVYRCAAHPATGMTWLAAKVYRPRMFRNLRNDKMYRVGRDYLTESGQPVKKSDHRVMRALGKKTAFGVQVAHTSWLMHEYMALERLYAAGAAVPRPLAASGNAVLMSYHGDERMAAPTLIQVQIAQEEATALLEEVWRNVELMLGHAMIHGDLSAYNILYWEGRITLIDFPQVTNLLTNPKARSILQRDITRVCEYFRQHGAPCDAEALLEEMWSRHGGPELDAAASALMLDAGVAAP